MIIAATNGSFVRAIKKGNLKRLEALVNTLTGSINDDYKWERKTYGGSLLHLAAFYNCPEIIEYLVKEKGLKLDRRSNNDWTPLHHAARAGSANAIDTLLKLGADPGLVSSNNKSPYDLCKNDTAAQESLRSYHEEQLRQQELNAQKKEQQSLAAEQAKVTGAWTLGASDEEVIFEREQSGLYLTETFNFAAKTRILMAESLKTGNLAQPETKSFSEIPERAEQARAEWARLHNDDAATETASVKPETKKYPRLTLNSVRS